MSSCYPNIKLFVAGNTALPPLVVTPPLLQRKEWPNNRVASLEGETLVVYYYVNASEIWRDNSDDLRWELP